MESFLDMKKIFLVILFMLSFTIFAEASPTVFYVQCTRPSISGYVKDIIQNDILISFTAVEDVTTRVYSKGIKVKSGEKIIITKSLETYCVFVSFTLRKSF